MVIQIDFLYWRYQALLTETRGDEKNEKLLLKYKL